MKDRTTYYIRRRTSRANRILYRNPEFIRGDTEEPRFSGSEKKDGGSYRAAERELRERREKRNRLEAWNRTLEQLTSSEVYDMTVSLTKIAGQYRRMLERRPSDTTTEKLDEVTERLQIARSVRADMNGWTKEPVQKLNERMAEVTSQLEKLEPRIRQAKEAATAIDSPRAKLPADYQSLPAGLVPGDILRLLVEERTRLFNDRETIQQILDSHTKIPIDPYKQ